MVTDEIILNIDNITGGYESRIDILHNTSIKVRRGEIACVIGPNGAGKSTLFRFIYGFLSPRIGDIYFQGECVTKTKPDVRLKMGMSYVPQGRCNFPLMTVRENLEMGAFTRRDKNITRDINRLLEMFPILGRKQKDIAGNMSGGEQQILEMAMTLMLHPQLLLLDEPSLGLSPKMVNFTFDWVKEINKQGVTIILVEQNATQGLRIADHGIVLVLGEKRFDGTGQEILNDPEVKRLYLGG